VLAGREEHVQLPWIRLVRDRRREREELVGRVAHRGNDHHEVRAARTRACDPRSDAPDPVRLGERRAPELLDHELNRLLGFHWGADHTERPIGAEHIARPGGA
jgi:hypothetical protein